MLWKAERFADFWTCILKKFLLFLSVSNRIFLQKQNDRQKFWTQRAIIIKCSKNETHHNVNIFKNLWTLISHLNILLLSASFITKAKWIASVMSCKFVFCIVYNKINKILHHILFCVLLSTPNYKGYIAKVKSWILDKFASIAILNGVEWEVEKNVIEKIESFLILFYYFNHLTGIQKKNVCEILNHSCWKITI